MTDQNEGYALSYSEIGGICIAIGMLLAITTPLIGAYYCIVWLQTGDWVSIKLSALSGPPARTTWAGFNKILEWFASSDIASLAAFGGVGLCFIGIALQRD